LAGAFPGWHRPDFLGRLRVKKSHVRFFSAEASQKNFSREIFSRAVAGGRWMGLSERKISLISRNDNIILRNDKPFFEENPYLCSVLIDK
jgi:hypothetical protein